MNGSFLLTVSIVFCAAFVQGITGFGFVVVCVPLLSLLVGVKFAIPVIALCGIILAGYLFFRLRKDFNFSDVLYLLLGGIPAIPLGALFLRDASEQIVKTALAVVIFSFCVLSLSKKIKVRKMDSRWGILFGFVSGLCGGAFNANAPAVLVYSYLQNWEKEKFKGTLSGYCFIMITLVVFSHIATGLTDIGVFISFAQLLPFLFLGVYMGHRLFGRIPTEAFKKIVLVFLMFVSVMLITL